MPTGAGIGLERDAAQSGLLRFIRYAFMPNHLGYCGGNQNEILLEHAATGRPDPKLVPFLTQFSGAVPYLKTIAAANGIRDPFDARVVEAYWIGNQLLAGVEARDLFEALEARFGGQLAGTVREQVLRKAPAGAKPYHLFHVLDVYRHLDPDDVGMSAMENCRISWGKVTAVDSAAVVVDRRPLEWREGKLALAEPRQERVLRSIDGLGFADDVAVGDWVSIHWGWACEVLDRAQLANLQRYSRLHLEIANQTL